MSLIVDINPVPWKILDLVKARILKNRAKKANRSGDWSKETLRREMSLQPVSLLNRKREEPSFTPSGSIHYSITILDRNTEYLKGTLTGRVADYANNKFVNLLAKWISKSQPVIAPLGNPQGTWGLDPDLLQFSATLVDRAQNGINDGWAGKFSFDDGYDLPNDSGRLWVSEPVVTNTGTYSALLNRDWENWSNKTTFKYNSQNELGEIENSGSKENKRFILLIPKIQGSAGIQVYPTQWPNLAGSSSGPVGFAITVAREFPLETTVTGPSDYYSLIEGTTGIPWSEVESVQIRGGSAASLNDELAFLAKLTDQSIPYSRFFGNSYTGSPFDDQESWVYPHSITP
jgi:hypothetical protein